MNWFFNTKPEREDMNVAAMPLLGRGKTSAEKQVRWLISNPPEVPFTKAVITPAFAQELLTYIPDESAAIRQRPLSKAVVKKYADQMRAGEWRETCVPIIFTKSEYLGDGQHRLSAVAESGTAQTFWLAFGDDDQNFYVFDTGKTRTKGDIFAIQGVPNATMAAAAIRWVYAYERGDLGAARQGNSAISTNERAFRYYEDHADIQASMKIYHAWSKKHMPHPSAACAMHYIAAQKNRDEADEFFSKVATGVGFKSQRDPAYKLRDKLVSGDDEPRPHIVVFWIVQAWNAMRDKKPAGRFRLPADSTFPRMR